MSTVISLTEKRIARTQRVEEARLRERQEDARIGSYGMQAFIEAVKALKQRSLSPADVYGMTRFLSRYFSLASSETEPTDLLEFEMDSLCLDSIPLFRGDVSAVVPDVKIAAQNERLTREMAVRIVSVARFVYRL